jgi:hypothetical protein
MYDCGSFRNYHNQKGPPWKIFLTKIIKTDKWAKSQLGNTIYPYDIIQETNGAGIDILQFSKLYSTFLP